ncbi:MAG: polysaccharide biosynthesis protein, partial [Actinobacteria bacterium]|nr:polysaccharide biosynthesis protein [Actinomycetota bacterium]
SGKWKFASFDEIWAIVRATALATVVIFVSLMLIGSLRAYVPVSVALTGAAISLLALLATRAVFRLIYEIRDRRINRGGEKVLLVGAGEAGEIIARDMLRNPTCGYMPCAFVDDNPFKRNLILQGVPVSGSRADIPDIVSELGIDEIFITMPSATGHDVREIVDISSTTGARVKILPAITSIMQDDPGLSAVRELQVEDLLGREPVGINLDLVSGYLRGKVVLVTGAAGSIGSELSKEILRFDPARLVLLDNDETALYNLQFDLQDIGEQFETVVADVREEERIKSIFERYRPAIVFHSAALKHVPMMELHPCEAVKNNVMGTLNLAKTAADYYCERFLLISTDKAVQPSNMMGATKRISELIMKGYNGKTMTVFGTVRFGNVLGSRGSVVPTFEAQIKKGGPVLVTDPEVRRYFMTLNEAANLVIQTGAYLHYGDLFVLDMGEPIKILDLAKKMIAMLNDGKPIDIKFTGLRPGEKSHEELAYRHEQLGATVHPKIAAIKDNGSFPEELYFGIDLLIDYAREEREEETREMLMDLVLLANHVSEGVSEGERYEDYLAKRARKLIREIASARSDSSWESALNTDGTRADRLKLTPGLLDLDLD